MPRQIQQLKNTAEVTIDPATNTSVSVLVANSTLASPSNPTSVALTDVISAAYTITLGKKNMVVQNTGDTIIAWGGSTLTFATGQKLYPTGQYEFRGCEDGFKIYFICNTGETGLRNICEM